MAYIEPILPTTHLFGSPVVITAADALQLIDGWIDLSLKRRRTLCSAIRILPRVLKLPLEAILMDAVTLNEAFSRASPASMGVSPASMPTYLNSIRSVLRRLGKVRDRRNPIMAPEWQALHDSLPSPFDQMGVAAFFHYLS